MNYLGIKKMEEGAKRVIRTCLNVHKDDEVLVITDEEKHDIGNEFYKAALEAHANPILTKTIVKHEGQEPPDALARLMGTVDVILIVSKYSMSQTKARRSATRAGARVASMPDITRDSLSHGGLTADFHEIEKLMRKVHRRIRRGRKVVITTPAGTELTLSIKGRNWITDDTGLCRGKGGFTTLPAGEIFIAPVEGTAEGKLIVDGSFAELLAEPAKLTISEGIAAKVAGAHKAILEMNKGGRDGRTVAKLGIGLNPKSNIIGNVLEDEKCLGTANIGFGGNSTFGGKIHSKVFISAVIKKPTITVGELIILEQGTLKV